MWFKNLSVFRLTEGFTLSSDELEQQLFELQFKPCGPHEETCLGWVPPVPKGTQLVHSSSGFMMVCVKKEERVLPSAVINEMVADKISELEDQRGHKLSKKERTEIKDELVFELLPRAFTFSTKTYAYIDPKGNWLVVDAASAKKAEDLASLLRKSLGSLPAVPLNTVQKPASIMTEWLASNQPPEDIAIEDECELRSPEEEGGIVRCKRHNLFVPEIKNHLDSGKEVIKLAVNWDGRLAFVLDETLSIKRLRFLDLVQELAADIDTDSIAAKFDADFSIMSMELANFLPRLLELFGGENRA